MSTGPRKRNYTGRMELFFHNGGIRTKLDIIKSETDRKKFKRFAAKKICEKYPQLAKHSGAVAFNLCNGRVVGEPVLS